MDDQERKRDRQWLMLVIPTWITAGAMVLYALVVLIGLMIGIMARIH